MEKRFYQVTCKDKDNELHLWRFPHDEQGRKETEGFIDWLKGQHEDYHDFKIEEN